MQDNLGIVKACKVTKALTIHWHSLEGSWVGFLKLGLRGQWTKTYVFLNSLFQLQDTRISYPLIWEQSKWKKMITRNPTKERGLSDYLDMPQILLICTFMIPWLFIWVNKGLECSKSSIKTIYHLLIWAMRELVIYYICLLSLFFFLFLCHVIFVHDILVGIFAMPMVFSPNFCLDHPFSFSI